MDTMTWSVVKVTYSGGTETVKVQADAWYTEDGDLVFYNGGTESRQGVSVSTQFNVRGFASGTWLGVSLHS